MKIYNVTDREYLISKHYAIGPGEYVDTKDAPSIASDLIAHNKKYSGIDLEKVLYDLAGDL